MPLLPQAFPRWEKVNFQGLFKCQVSYSWSHSGTEGQSSFRNTVARLSLYQVVLQNMISFFYNLQKQLVTSIENKLGQHSFILLK